MDNFRPALKHRLGTNYIVYMGRFWGAKLPKPEYVPIYEAWRVAQWIGDTIDRWGGCYVVTTPSKAVVICQVANELGSNIAGTKFLIGAEPITKMKRQED